MQQPHRETCSAVGLYISRQIYIVFLLTNHLLVHQLKGLQKSPWESSKVFAFCATLHASIFHIHEATMFVYHWIGDHMLGRMQGWENPITNQVNTYHNIHKAVLYDHNTIHVKKNIRMISFLIDSKEKQYNIAQFNLLLE